MTINEKVQLRGVIRRLENRAANAKRDRDMTPRDSKRSIKFHAMYEAFSEAARTLRSEFPKL